MKAFGYISLICVITLSTVSCLNDNDSYYQGQATVPITEFAMPDTVLVNQPVEIQAVAEAPNTCWNKVQFDLVKNTEFNYTFGAIGFYQSLDNCQLVTVYGDTTLIFTPTQTGEYIFGVVKTSVLIENDTLIVK